MSKPKKNIFILVTSAGVGGAQMSVLNLARELSARGNLVSIGAGVGDFLPEECRKSKIEFIRLKNLRRSLNPMMSFFFFLEVRKLFKERPFDVLHINSSNALLSAPAVIGLGKKTVFTFRGLSLLDKNYELSWLVRYFYTILFRFLTSFCDHTIFVSKENYESAKDIGLAKKGSVILNGLDPKEVVFVEKDIARKEFEQKTGRLLKDSFVLGSIGRLAYQKNYEFLIDAWPMVLKKVPNAVCFIFGDGPKKEELSVLIQKNKVGESFFLLGSEPNASRFLKGFDLFVLPSLYEGLSITTIETLFAGVPMLISRTGGNPEVVGGFEPFLFDINDRKQFLEKLEASFKDPNLHEKTDNVSKENSSNFLLSRTAQEYERIYEK